MVVRCFTSFALHKQKPKKKKKDTTNTRDNNNKKQHRWYIETAELNTAKWKATRAKCRFKVSTVSIDRSFLVSFGKNRRSHDARHEPGPQLKLLSADYALRSTMYDLQSTVYGVRKLSAVCSLQATVHCLLSAATELRRGTCGNETLHELSSRRRCLQIAEKWAACVCGTN